MLVREEALRMVKRHGDTMKSTGAGPKTTETLRTHSGNGQEFAWPK